MQLRLALISIGIAVVLTLIGRTHRRAPVLIVTSIVGAAAGLAAVIGRVSDRICDGGPAADRCSGVYIEFMGGDHRLPQFLQLGEGGTLIAAAVAGAVLLDLIALTLMWAWDRRHPSEPKRVVGSGIRQRSPAS